MDIQYVIILRWSLYTLRNKPVFANQNVHPSLILSLADYTHTHHLRYGSNHTSTARNHQWPRMHGGDTQISPNHQTTDNLS